MPLPASVTTARTTVVADFLRAAGWDDAEETGYPLIEGTEIITSPDQAVFIAPVGGPGYVTEEGSADAWAMQLRVRGPADDHAAAMAAAQALDWLILNAAYPAAADGVSIRAASRMGSAPAELPLDPDDRRFEFTCSYIFVTGA